MTTYRLSAAIKEYRAEMLRQFTTNTVTRYTRELNRFREHVGNKNLSNITVDDCRSFLDTFDSHEPATVALENTILAVFFRYMVQEGKLDKSPMDRVKRPKVPPLEHRKVVTISTEDVARMLEAAQTWTERLCLGVFAFMGVRRTAASQLRWKDVDLKRGTATFLEKGGKTITKPIPDELVTLFREHRKAHPERGPEDFVIPSRRDPARRKRSNRLVYEVVKEVAERANVVAHCHAIRAAFAVRYLQDNPGRAEALQWLMGHSNIATTYGYLRKYDRMDAMESVRPMTYRAAA